MTTHTVLVVASDDWERLLFSRVLEESDFSVLQAASARDGLKVAKESLPHCIICDMVLADVDGLWFAGRLRSTRGAASRIPLIVLAPSNSEGDRVMALDGGADLVLKRPVTHEELVAQVRSFVQLAHRLRTHDSFLDNPGSGSVPTTPAFRGELSSLSPATLLSMLELERRTGSLKIVNGGETLRLLLREGRLLSIQRGQQALGLVEGLEILMQWAEGRFYFRAGGRLPLTSGEKVGPLILEALRRVDEQAAGR